MVRSRVLGTAASLLILAGQALNGIPASAAAPAGAPTVVQELKHDRSQPLRSMHASQLDPNGKGPQPHRQPMPPHASSRGVTASGSLQSSSAGMAMPNTSTNFEGIGNLDGVLPPDANGDIGPNNYVQWVNVHYQIFNRAGTSILGPSPGNTLWSGFGGVCATTNQGDPVVRYDRNADRWIFTQFAFNVDRNGNPVAPYVQCFAISTTGDPTGTYYRYAFQISTTLFNDYPKLAVWPDAFYMTFNYFDLSLPAAQQFQGAGAWAFHRSKMLAGQAATAINFQTSISYGSLLASDLDGSIQPPAGSANYVAAIDTPVSGSVALSGSTLFIWKFHVDWTTPANSTFGTTTHLPDYNLTVASYKWDPCAGSQNCVTQPGTTVGLDPLADRLMNRLQYRRFADGHESLVANHSVGVGASGNQLAVRWYEIRSLSTTPTVYQQGTYQPDSNNRWMGSLAMDQAGDIGLGYSVSSSSVYPSIRYTGRLVSDPLGTLPQGEGTSIAGSGSQTSTYYRWGDYGMMAVDPTDDCTFWYTQEYYTATSDRGWRTRIVSFKYQSCGPPLIMSSVQASNIDSSSAVITWLTNNSADSRVDFGATSSYGSSVSEPTSVTSHSEVLTGLANNAAYHFKTTSTDTFGQSASSADETFTTSTNLISNGGFEAGGTAWSLAPQASIDINPADARTGNSSLKLVATGPWQGTWQYVAVTAGKSYSFGAWGRSNGGGGYFSLISFDANGNQAGPHSDFSFVGSTTWASVAGTYTAAPNTTRVAVIPQSSASGTFWFDDINFSPTSNLLANSGFELGGTSWSLAAQAQIDTMPGDAHSGTNSLELVATAPWQGTWQFASVSAGQAYSFTASGRSNAAGGDFTLIGFDANWNQVGPHSDFVFGSGSGWVPIAGTYVAQPNTAHVAVIPQSSGIGTFWFDDLSLTPTANFVANGGFEAGSAAWSLATQAAIDTNRADAHGGNNSLELVATAPWQGTWQFVGVTAGQVYSFSAWGRSVTGGGDFTLISFDANWNQTGAHDDFPFVGNGSWNSVAGTYVAPPSTVRVALIPQSSMSGTFWFDDAVLETK